MSKKASTNSPKNILPWSPAAMKPRRDWIYSEVRKKFRPFVSQEGIWQRPPALNEYPDPRVFVQVAAAYFSGDEKDRELARNLLLSESVTDRMTRKDRCAFTIEYVVALSHMMGSLMPDDLRKILLDRACNNLMHYASRDLRHHGYNDNHVTLATGVLVLAGEISGDKEAVEEGKANLLNFRDTFLRRGFMHEMNDCYIPHTLYPIAAIAEWSKDKEIRELARDCEARIWVDWIGHWHPNLARKPGPSARDYTRGRLHPLVVNTALWSIFGDDFGQPLYPAKDVFGKRPKEHYFDFNGNPFDGTWDLGFITWMSSHVYHIPADVAPLIYKRNYPHVIRGTHEVGHSSESLLRSIAPDPKTGHSTRGEVIPNVIPFGAREIYTYQYQEKDWAMGTASQRMIGNCPNNNWGVYYRKSSKLDKTSDQGLLFSSFTINEKSVTGEHDFSLDPNDLLSKNHEDVEHWFDNGKYAGIQHERTSILLYRPRVHDRHHVTSLATTMVFPLCFKNEVQRVELGDRKIENFNGYSKELDDLFVQDGSLYIAIRPLIPVDLPADVRVRFEREEFWGTVHFYSYRGSALAFEEIDLCRAGGGFLCEVATKDDFRTLEDFKAWFRKGDIFDHQEYFMRQVRYHRKGLDLGMRWDVWADTIMYRTLNGREYPMPKFECTGVDLKKLPWLTGDVSGLDHYFWAKRQAQRPRQNWPETALALKASKSSL